MFDRLLEKKAQGGVQKKKLKGECNKKKLKGECKKKIKKLKGECKIKKAQGGVQDQKECKKKIKRLKGECKKVCVCVCDIGQGIASLACSSLPLQPGERGEVERQISRTKA
jgi:hypothetical protein